MATGPNAREILTTVKAFFLSAEFHIPRDTIGVDLANLQDFKKVDNAVYPETMRGVVALSQTLKEQSWC